MPIDSSKYTAHQHPGKFEGETPATEYFHERMLEGDGEEIYAPAGSEDGLEDIDSPAATLFQVNAEEAEAFTLTVGAWFLLREDTQGFALGSTHATREEAEERFRAWAGY